MALKSRNKVNAEFSMSSMTDIVFLLLIFFMLTSSFVVTNTLNVNLPTSKVPTKQIESVSVSISKDLQYSVDNEIISKGKIESVLTSKMKGKAKEERVVVLRIDKDVPVEHLVEVASISAQLDAKISIATKPE